MKKFLLISAVAALLLAFWLQMLLAMPKLSATTDEVAHLPAGYTYWAVQDFRMNPEHPPLTKLLAALPLLALKPRLDTSWPDWKNAQEYFFGYAFLYTNNADRLLFWGRVPMTVLATAGAFVVFLWARSMYGTASGLFALTLFAFSPNLLAHGMLVTTDVPLAVFMTLALYLLWKQQPHPSPMSSAMLGVATGAAMASKFSGSVLPLIVIVFSAWRVYDAHDRRSQTLIEVRNLAIAGVAALFVIEASYFFLAPPWIYFQNMRLVNVNHNPNHLFYLLGQFSLSGWWYYFLVAFAVKATIPLLLTLLLAIGHLALKRFLDARGETLILIAVLFYVLAVILGADDIGVRYLLPIFPLLYVWSSRIITELNYKNASLALVVVLGGWQMREAINAFPNYIPYFNQLAGGASSGIEFLDDSNVDWGQSMKQAGEYIRNHQLENVELLPFSPFDSPQYYGVRRPPRDDLSTYRMMISDQPHPGTYIVSAHHLTRMMYIRPEWNPKNAVDRIGDSLWVYRF